MSLVIDNAMYVRAARHENGGYGPAHQYAVGIDGHPSIIILMLEILSFQYGPRFFQCHPLHSIQQIIGNLWTTIGESFTLPLRAKKNQFFPRNLLPPHQSTVRKYNRDEQYVI